MDSAVIQAHRRVDEQHWWFAGRVTIVRALLHEIFGASSRRGVVDVGCGTGATLAGLAQDFPCTGVDVSPEAVAVARERLPEIPVLCGSASDALRASTTAGAVLLMDVLEHVADDEGLLREVVEPLARGAHVIVTVPHDPRLWSPHDVALGHYRRYTQSNFAALWRGLPLNARLVTPFNARLYLPVRLIRSATAMTGRSWGDAGTDLRTPPRPLNRLLRSVFASEAAALVAMLRGRRSRFAAGVSLLAVLRKT